MTARHPLLIAILVLASASAFNLVAPPRAPGAVAPRRPTLRMQEDEPTPDEAQPAPVTEEAPAPQSEPEKFSIGGVGPYAIFGVIAAALLAKDYLLGDNPLGG